MKNLVKSVTWRLVTVHAVSSCSKSFRHWSNKTIMWWRVSYDSDYLIWSNKRLIFVMKKKRRALPQLPFALLAWLLIRNMLYVRNRVDLIYERRPWNWQFFEDISSSWTNLDRILKAKLTLKPKLFLFNLAFVAIKLVEVIIKVV